MSETINQTEENLFHFPFSFTDDEEDDIDDQDETQRCYCSETTEWQTNDIPICDRSRGCRRLICNGFDGVKLYVSEGEETCVYKNLYDPEDEPIGYWCRDCKELHINNDKHNFIDNGCWTLKDPKTKEIQEVCSEILNLVEDTKKEMNDQTYIMLTEKLMNIHNR